VPGYEVLGLLGRGGMGVVYQARQVQADRLVALKMILHAEHTGADGRTRFQSEARAVARLQHPHIVQVYEVGEHNGLPFFSLELCAGGGLDRKLAGTPLEARPAAALVEKLARAMQAAHQAHIIHRDLKPANVLLTAEGEPKITDFGLAKRLDEQGRTQTGVVMGTPSYMAPEQAGGGKEVGPAADVYALGAILYECLTGRPPFKAATVMDTLYQVIHDEPVPPSQLQSKVPRDLETICLKCLHKEPGKRYATAAALADDLGRFQRGEPIAARPVGRLERGWRWCRRNPALAGALVAVVLVFVTGATASAVLAVLANQRAEEATRARGDAQAEAQKAQQNEFAVTEVLHLLPEALSPAAGHRMEPVEAAKAASALRQAMTKTTNPSVLEQLARVLSEVAGHMGPRQAAAECGPAAVTLTQAMAKTTNRYVLKQLARGLSAVAGRMGAKEAAEVAAALRQAMAKTRDPFELQILAQALSAVAGRMEPEEAVAVCRPVAADLTQAMTRTKDPYALAQLARGLSAVVGRLGAKEAAEAAAALSEAMTQPTNHVVLFHLAEALSAVAARMEPREATATLTEAMNRMAPWYALRYTLEPLARGLSAVAARMEAKEAAAALTQAMANTLYPFELRHLARVLSEVAGRLPPEEAAAVCGPVAANLTQAMNRTKDPYAWAELAEALSAVAVRLEPKEAVAALSQAMAKTADRLMLFSLAKGLSAVAGRLGAKEAAEAAAALRQAMTRTADHVVLDDLAQVLSAVAARMEPEKAAAACGQAAATLSQAMTRTTNPGELRSLAQVLSAVLLREGPGRNVRRGHGLVGVVGTLTSPGSMLSAPALLQLALATPPLPAQTLVDLLKQPYCVGEAQRLVLEQLTRHYGRPFAGQADFLRFAREQKLPLDLTTPPQRPEQVATPH
jgi:hypothetical protein